MRPGWVLLALVVALPGVEAAEIIVRSGNGARAAVGELVQRFERESGHKVDLRFAVNPEARRTIEAGERFDVAILNPPVIDALVRGGRIVPDSRIPLGTSGIGVGIRAGVPKPDISSVEAFKRTLREARTIAYPAEGASGKYFASLVDYLEMTAELQPKLRPMPAEYNVEGVAKGEFELVVVVASRIAGVNGVQLVGAIPEELQVRIGFTAGLGTGAPEPEAARAFLKFLATPGASAVLQANGVEPPANSDPVPASGR